MENAMSRYNLEGNLPGLRIVVGWDNPLETYFAQVWSGPEPKEGSLQLWTGTMRSQLTTVESLVTQVAPYGDIPPAVLAQLRDDPHSCGEPTPLQKYLRK
jgi:hypothetical protein